jgi:hypothetical protein
MADRAEKIHLGPWTISVSRAQSGGLSIEVLLGEVPHTKIELDEGGSAKGSRRSKSDARSKSAVDMEF